MPAKLFPMLIAASLPIAVLAAGPMKRPPLLIDGPAPAATTARPPVRPEMAAAGLFAAVETCLSRNTDAVVHADGSGIEGRDVSCLQKL
ncbi:MAG: hypothetical protein GC155_18135 [Alphaproteobacteria bacterium]|nr:hypothetical protein [Alphaproteobacteria bacterium]